MAIMQLKSTNPKFGFIIVKNPANPVLLKSMRKGMGYAWYTKGREDEFNIYFRDAQDAVSFQKTQDQQFEYLDLTRYASPLFLNLAISTFLASAAKGGHEDDVEGYENVVRIPFIRVPWLRQLDLFMSHFPGFEMEAEEHLGKFQAITIRTKLPISKLINLTQVLGLFMSILADEYVDVSEPLVKKYIDAVNAINAPYFIRYLFKGYILRNKKMFDVFKESLEGEQSIILEFGNNLQQRQFFVRGQISGKQNVLDVGCGEGKYFEPVGRLLKDDAKYLAWDSDDKARERAKRTRAKPWVQSKKIQVLDAFPTKDDAGKCDIILTEVLEHMELEQAEALIRDSLFPLDFQKIIITTPNKDFNKYYLLDDDASRHDDHKFEFTEGDVVAWVDKMFSSYQYVLYPLGDVVDGVPTAWGIVVMNILTEEAVAA